MKLFRNQIEYDFFNEKMSLFFNVTHNHMKLCEKQNVIDNGKTITPWNKGLKNQQIPWNKGLTKNQDARISSKPMTEEHKNKISKKLLGHEISPESRTKMSASKRGKPAWNKGKKINSENFHKVKVTNGEIIFDSVKEAAAHEKVTPAAIIRRIKTGKKWSYFKDN